MTSQSQSQLKEELRGRVADFAITGHLINTSTTRKPKEQEIQVEEAYKKLEKWIFENIANIKLEDEPEEEERLDPDTNNASMFPAEGSDMDF